MPDINPSNHRHILRLSDEVSRRAIWSAKRGARFTKLRDLAAALDLPKLAQVLADHPDVTTRPLVTSVPFPRLLELEESAARSGYPLERSLSSYWVIESRGYRRARSLVADMGRKGLFSVAALGKRGGGRVYEEPELTEAGAPTQPWHFLPGGRGYWSAAPDGIDARYAWRKGFGGEGVRFVDVERSWNFEHRGLQRVRFKFGENGARTPFYNESLPVAGEGNCPEHGTNVLGVVAGWDSREGHRGIAPNCSSVATVSQRRKKLHGLDDWDLVGAILYAVSGADELLGFGDVLLIEVQTLDNLPVEVVEHYYLATKLAVGNGIIVVECGGNAGCDLDRHWEITGDWSPTISMCRDDERFRDSGAIVVAAGQQRPVKNRKGRWCHAPWHSTNYGTRIDCYAWGESIRTAGGGDGGMPCNERYTSRFGGTSGAGAIIAGAAILVQQMFMSRARGRHLPPDEMRQILSHPKHGTPGCGHEIGIMPNLRKIYERMQAGKV